MINAHTDYYLWEVVVRPAVRRARELDGKGKGPKVGHGWEDSKRRLPNREQYCLVGQRLGIPREVSEREYDAWKAGRKAKGKG